MPRPEILERSPLEILVDDRGAHVGGARHRGRIAEVLRDTSHHRGDGPSRRSLGFGNPVAADPLGEVERGEERPAPRPEILRGEPVAEVDLHVVVQPLRGEVPDLVLPAVAEDARTRQLQELTHRCRELVVDDRPAYLDLVLAAERDRDPISAHVDVTARDRRDPVGVRLADVALVADAKPALVDEAQRNRRHALTVEHVLVHVLGHRLAERGQSLAEADQLVELRLLLRRAEVRVVEVLPPARLVEAGRLQLRARARRDPDVLPCRRDDELADPLEPRLVRDLAPDLVVVAEAALRAPLTGPPHAPAHVAVPVRPGRAVIRRPTQRADRPGRRRSTRRGTRPRSRGRIACRRNGRSRRARARSGTSGGTVAARSSRRTHPRPRAREPRSGSPSPSARRGSRPRPTARGGGARTGAPLQQSGFPPGASRPRPGATAPRRAPRA